MKNKKLLIIALILLIFIWTIYITNKDFFSLSNLFKNIDSVNNFINANLVLSFIIYVIAYIFLVICNFPFASMLSLTGGFLLGTWLGGIGIIIGASIGSFIVFVIANFFFKDFLERKILFKYPLIVKYFKENQIELMLLIRLVPGIPFFAQNLILAALGANNQKFFITTLLGVTPWAFIFASIGQGLDEIFYHQKAISLNLMMQPNYIIPIAIIIILILLILFYKKKFKKII